MKEKILEIINKRAGYIYMGVNNALSEDITAHVMEFVDWVRENQHKDHGYSINFFQETEEVYQYWLNNVKK